LKVWKEKRRGLFNMLNEHNDKELDIIREEVESFIFENVCNKFTFTRLNNIRFVKDHNPGGIGSVESLKDGKYNIRLEPKNIKNLNFCSEINFKECLKCIAIHELFHMIFPELNQVEAFKKMDEGNSSEYHRIETLNWDYVEQYFPDFKNTITSLRTIYR